MDIEDLRSFLAVADLGNITHAADRLHVSQPTLSRRISGLERELGVSLVRREHRSVSLTAAGKVLQGEAQQIVHRVDQLPALLASAEGREVPAAGTTATLHGALHLAHQAKIDESTMADISQRIRAQYPDVSFEVSHGYPTELRAGAGSGRYDAVFFLRPHLRHRSPRTTYVLGESELMLMVPANHPFAGRESVDISELQGQKVIMLERKVSPEIVDFVNSRFIDSGFSLDAARYVRDFDNGVVQVAAGNGVSFCHKMMSGLEELHPHDVRLVRLTGADVTFDYVMRLSDGLTGMLRRVLVDAATEVAGHPLAEV